MTTAALGLLLLALQDPVPVCGSPWQEAVRLSVTDPRDVFEFDLDPTLLLQVVNIPHARVPSMGWEIVVVRKPAQGASRNLLYHSQYFHGPYPTDFLAWIKREGYFPDERGLEVYGTDFEIRGELIDAETAMDKDVAVFTAGRLIVSYRRLWPCPSMPAAGEPTFSRAYLTGGDVCFESPVPVDWEALARQTLHAFPLEDPPRDRLLTLGEATGSPILPFSAALPKTFEGLRFYLLTESGVRSIEPRELHGWVRYRDSPPARPELERFSGEVCMPVPAGLRDAGFVVSASYPVSWQTAPAALVRSGATTLVRLEEGASSLPPPGLDGGAVEVKSAHILYSTALPIRYLLVRRVAQCPSVCCEFTYDIYRWEPGLPVIASNTYGCDI